MKKKTLLVVMVCSLFLTGCLFENPNLDFENLGVKLDNLETEEFSRTTASLFLDERNADLSPVYDYDFKEVFNLDSSNIEDYSISKTEDNSSMYFIVKPIKDKEETVKKEIDAYIDKLDKSIKDKLTYAKYQDYLIYIIDDNSKNLMEDVKNSRSKLFTSLTEVDADTLSSRYGIDASLTEEFLVRIPTMMVNANEYAIIKPAKGKKAEVKRKMSEYFEKLENQWSTYLPDQYDLVKNRYEKEYGEYLIYIVSTDNDLVYKTIKKQ